MHVKYWRCKLVDKRCILRKASMPETKFETINFLLGLGLLEVKVKGRSFLLFVIIVLLSDNKKNCAFWWNIVFFPESLGGCAMKFVMRKSMS